MPSTTTPPSSGARARLRRHRVPLAIGAVIVLGVGLALTQPWTKFIDDVVDQDFAVSIADAADASGDAPDDASTIEESTIEESMAEESMADASVDAPVAPGAPSGPVLLASGTFVDRSHPTSGQAAFFALEDGTRVLRLEGFATDNGPDLFVYLDTDGADAPAAAYDDGISLGRLEGNIGDQTYVVPDEVDLSSHATVVIWCDRFGVAFGSADLA